jgi:hypothetical protein
MFDDDSDEGGDLFSPKEKKTIPSSIPAIKIEPIPTPQSTTIRNKLNPIARADESDEDEIFGMNKTPAKPAPIIAEKKKSPSSDEELFIAKPSPAPTKKLSEDENPLFTSQSSVPTVVPAPAVVPTVKKPAATTDDDSDDQMFGISKKPPAGTQKIVSPLKLHNDEDEDDEIFGKPTPKPKVLPTETRKVTPAAHSDDDEISSPTKPQPFKLPPPVVLPPLPSVPSTKTDVYDDPLGIGKPVETVQKPIKTSSVPIKQTFSDDNVADEESSPPKRALNVGALEDGEKAGVKDLLVRQMHFQK